MSLGVVIDEVSSIISSEGLDCDICDFHKRIDFMYLVSHYNLSDNFLRVYQNFLDWEVVCTYQELSEDFIREFSHKVDWCAVSIYQKLSEDFVREFKDNMHFDYMCRKPWSEGFIREFKDQLDLNLICTFSPLSVDFMEEFFDDMHIHSICVYQRLSEDFIRRHSKFLDFSLISCYQELSEDFIREFQDKVNWEYISISQNLSSEFIEEFKDKIDIKEYERSHKILTYEEKLEEVKKYCEKYNLELDLENKCFYAYRRHFGYGSGQFNSTILYEKGKCYRDWHLDMRGDVQCSFGLGISSTGNTKVKVLIEDFGVFVSDERGEARVWGFEVISTSPSIRLE